jgi:hypothetical protein
MLIPVLALITAASVSATGPEAFFDATGWLIMPLNHSCAMVRTYKDDSQIFITDDAGMNDVIIAVGDKKFKSITKGKTYHLSLHFTNGHKSARTVPVLATGVFDGEKPGFKTEPLLSTLLGDISESTNIAFLRRSTPVDSFRLGKSRKAVAALRKCAEGLYRANPSDPPAY